MTTVGIDVGGTKCHGVLVDGDGRVLRETRHPTPDADGLVDVLLGIVAELGGHCPVGVGVPGLVTPEGVITASPNLRGARKVPVGPALRSALGSPVHVENDATAAAYGEWTAGAARGANNALLVTLGTGIGGGIVMGGTLHRGAHGFAGEIGHMTVEADGIECPCGRRGCWERYASGSALSRMGGGRSGEEVVEAARRGEAAALTVIDDFARWVAVGVSSLTNVVDPEVVVLGGGVIGAWDVWEEPVRRWADLLLYASQHRARPRIEPASLGAAAGAVGSALLARDLL
ncbi:MAG: ROK family protein [Ilumatobacteraceae bacterium]